MNVIDDAKLQSAADEAVDRAASKLAAIFARLFLDLDGWMLTIKIPPFALFGWAKLTIAIPEITVRLCKPKGTK